jgi:hypothetical protein
MLLLASLAHTEDTLTFSGPVPAEGDFFTLDVEVPEGTAEIEVAHRSTGEGDILDWGLYDPAGFRGWGGGNSEAAIVGVDAASRSYLAGPMPAGTWTVLVGKAKVTSDAPAYEVDITLRESSTLPAEPARRPYEAVDLGGGPRWYAGDFHVHSRESGDASPSLDAIADFARSRGLDFVELSEHNTTSVLQWLGDAQDRRTDLLFLPGVEITTYAGHANGIGLTVPVPFAMGWEVADFAATAERVAAEGAVLSINHPMLALGDACIGCAWEHPVPETLGAIEIATGAWSKAGQLFDEPSIALWDSLCDEGVCPAAIGGSDDHTAGTGTGAFDSPIGSPTTLVWAESLSAAAILDGLRAGRTVVKLEGPDDPMIELSSEGFDVTALVTGGAGNELRFVVDGVVAEAVNIDADPFTFTTSIDGTRVRAEVWLDDTPRTITSHLFPEDDDTGTPTDPEPCGCSPTPGTAPGTTAATATTALLLTALRRKGPRRRR